jgi:hypothetical protein
MAKLHAFQRDQQDEQAGPAPPSNVAFAACDNVDELIKRLSAAETELAASKVNHLAINPVAGEPVAYIATRDFIDALPRD